MAAAAGDTTFRAAAAADVGHVQRALYLAATWVGERPDWPPERVMAHDYFVMYHEGWGRTGDVGVIAEAGGVAVGAAYGRLFTDERHGAGSIDEGVPEIVIGVEADRRGEGIGGRLLRALADAYRAAGVTVVSLSVEKDNPAVGLYEWHGFVTVDEDDHGLLMAKRLDTALQPAHGPRTGDVERKLAALHPDAGMRGQARDLLERYGSEDWHREVERVRLAVLRLGGGDLMAMARHLDEANRDYRDVLAAAEYPRVLRLGSPTDPASAVYREAVEADADDYLAWVRS